jgi:multisubunit Na+/H+ antiporter MnhB subunit
MPGDAPDRPPRQPPAWNVPASRLLPAADRQDPADRSALLEVVTRILHPTVVMVSGYLLLAGHDRPGGGFAAGLVAALGLVLRYLAGGPQELRVASPVDPGPLLGAGLAVAAGYAAVGVVAAGSPLAATTWSIPLGVLGHLEVSSSLAFDAGVFLIVVGLAVDVLRTLGAVAEGRAAAGAEQEERP